MHATLYEKIYGYIDEETETENNLKLQGWHFFLHDKEKGLATSIRARRVGDGESTYFPAVSRERRDVIDFYNNGKNPTLGVVALDPNCGWSVNVTDVRGDVELQMLVPTFMDGSMGEGPAWKWVTFYKCTLKLALSKDVFKLKKEIFLPTFATVDHFYEDPDAVREFALQQKFEEHPKRHKGYRTNVVFKSDHLREQFERILNVKIDREKWKVFDVNGCFQYCPEGTEVVYHCDRQDYAGIVYLSPDAPPESGTSIFRSKVNKLMRLDDEHAEKTVGKTYDERFNETFANGFYDRDQFDLVDVVGNVYNRLILFNGRNIHAASSYFGTTKESARLFHLFFFDLEK